METSRDGAAAAFPGMRSQRNPEFGGEVRDFGGIFGTHVALQSSLDISHVTNSCSKNSLRPSEPSRAGKLGKKSMKTEKVGKKTPGFDIPFSQSQIHRELCWV